MKKIFLLIILFVVCLSGYSQLLQKTYRWNETITLDASAGDTIYFWAEFEKDFTIGAPWSLSILYSTLTTADVKLGLCASNIIGAEGSLSIDGTNAYIVLDNTSGKNYRGELVKSDNAFSYKPILFDRLALYIITDTEVSGTIEFEFIQRLFYNK